MIEDPNRPDRIELERMLGFPFQEHQAEALEDAEQQVLAGAWLRLCLYHRTGAGKTYTSLGIVALSGAHEVLVLAPPITHSQWVAAGARLELTVTPISHAKFRQKDFKVHRSTPIIVDEFHLLGGHKGMGWKKLDRLARGLQAPLVLASATPNYNDAERVYCVQHVLDPSAAKGGYIQWLYDNCETEVNPFGAEPQVTGFRKYLSAEEFLADLPGVHYVEDEVIKTVAIGDVVVTTQVPDEFERYGLLRTQQRIVASQMEERHRRKRLQILDEDGTYVKEEIYQEIAVLCGSVATPTLLFCASSQIAAALHRTIIEHGAKAAIITGDTGRGDKAIAVARFLAGDYEVLIGTATMATGLDGVDKMCDHLLIVDDTDDDSLRRQLMGRILPRGLDDDASGKVFTRLVYSS